jgi:amidase
VWGHKPSFGVIPTLGYLDEPDGGTTESDVNTFGPIARSAADLRLLLDVLAGPSPADAAGWRLRLPEPGVTSVRGLRVGAWLDEPALEIDAGTASVLGAAVDALEAAGAHVDRGARPAIDCDRAWRLGARLIGAAVSISGGDRGLTHRDWLLLNRERAALRAAWAECFQRVDVVLCPVAIAPAFPHLQDGEWDTRTLVINGRERRYLELEGWPAVVGAAYLPSTSVPVGRTAAGLPVGLQVVAPYLHDRRAITVGGWLGELVGGYAVPPVVG